MMMWYLYKNNENIYNKNATLRKNQNGSSVKLRSLQKKDFKILVDMSNSETDFNKIRQYAEEAYLCIKNLI